LLGGLLALAAGLATFGSAAPAPAAEGPRVFMVDNEPDLTRWHFDPAEISVPAGATVVWTNQGKEDHTVTADDNSFDSGYKKTGTTFQRAFPRPGKYSYHCSPHPWMKGTVLVVAGAAAPTGAAEATTSTTAAPAASSSTFPPLTAPGAVPPEETSTSAPAATTATGPGSDSGASAAPASSRKRSGGNLAGTLAIVLLPTLGGLAIGARLRRSKA
jgi:plastocyanin